MINGDIPARKTDVADHGILLLYKEICIVLSISERDPAAA